jgi:hypothetical protein
MRKLIEMPYEEGSKVLVGVDVPADPDEIRQVGVLNFFKGKPEPVEKSRSEEHTSELQSPL